MADLPFEHHLWKHEMFVPITTIGKVASLDEAMRMANDVNYGLTAGFYGSPEESEWFFDQYRSRCYLCEPPAGRDNRRLAGLPALWRLERFRFHRQEWRRCYYLPLYMHEQIRTLVR